MLNSDGIEVRHKKSKCGTRYIITREEFQKVEKPEIWTLKIFRDRNELYRKDFDINVPSLAFYTLAVSQFSKIKSTKQDGFFAEFQCGGYPPNKTTFSGRYINEDEREFDVHVDQGKGINIQG